jgi:hypothetical protein
MARKPGSGQLDLAEVFLTVQHEMLAHLAVGDLFEHPFRRRSRHRTTLDRIV